MLVEILVLYGAVFKKKTIIKTNIFSEYFYIFNIIISKSLKNTKKLLILYFFK